MITDSGGRDLTNHVDFVMKSIDRGIVFIAWQHFFLS